MSAARIPNAGPLMARRLGKTERGLQDMKRIGAELWVYVGTYPDDPKTRFESPPWENSFGSVTGRRVRFRHGLDGLIEIEGQFDLTSGAVSGDVAFTLPPEYIGDSLDAFIPVELDDGVWSSGVLTIDGITGEVRVFWPIVADPIP